MQTNLYFVRHAHSTYTPDELGRPLSKKGFTDAETITKVLRNEKIDIVVSSPYMRAIQTVEGIANLIGKEMIIKDSFKERILSEQPVDDFFLVVTKSWEDFHFSLAGGESNNLAQKRGIKETLQLLKKYEGQNIVVGSHGNMMVLIMNYFDRYYDFSFWEELEMPDIVRLTFENSQLKSVKKFL